ncbi:DNA N(6)-methyladenine demethylase ALKBH1D-like [Rutidosis leptorrhynchoides]|uniref:DNA N(6)-methyladenine demethylase ALKBH1D-like n=1 Tax=Rutidosis leptorrhynchoides TaxID=125765 RepID=UPI003A98E711
MRVRSNRGTAHPGSIITSSREFSTFDDTANINMIWEGLSGVFPTFNGTSMVAFHRSTVRAYDEGSRTFLTGLLKQYHKGTAADYSLQTEPFSLSQPRDVDSACESPDTIRTERKNNVERSYEILDSGMVLLKNYLSISDQVEVANICQELGVGPGGFYQPVFANGAKMKLQMMCLGRNWDPQTYSYKRYRGDGSEAPPLPDQFISLVETAIQESRDLSESKNDIPLMSPDICIINFYTDTGRLGLHQDKDESHDSLSKGLPVVSISIGDTAEFLYGYTRDKQKASKVWLKSGDVLIFGGKSRHIFHGVDKIIPNSAPLSLTKETTIPGRLNLTFRKY